MALNTELLQRVRDKIAATPESYDQEVYGRPETSAPCGTAACIAGWTVVLADEIPMERVRLANADYWNSHKDKATRDLFDLVPNMAARLLGLNADEQEAMFTAEPEGADDEYSDEREGGWPEPFASQWAEGEIPRHEIAVAYIDECLKRGKVTW